MSVAKLMSLMVAFVAIGMLAFLGINWFDTVPAPTNTSSSEYQQYTNLTDTVEISYVGVEGIILFLIIALIIVTLIILIKAVKIW